MFSKGSGNTLVACTMSCKLGVYISSQRSYSTPALSINHSGVPNLSVVIGIWPMDRPPFMGQHSIGKTVVGHTYIQSRSAYSYSQRTWSCK